jgi:hypothetical protein
MVEPTNSMTLVRERWLILMSAVKITGKCVILCYKDSTCCTNADGVKSSGRWVNIIRVLFSCKWPTFFTGFGTVYAILLT